MHDLARPARATIGPLLISILLAACSSSTASPPSGTGSPPPDVPVATNPPSQGGSDGSGGALPPPDGAVVVVPKPGQLDVHPVSAESFAATVDGRTVAISVDWWSGVEPCTVLDSIVVERGDGTYAITLREGRGPGDVACIAIAELHRTFIDLGELEPGTYLVTDATGGAPAIEVVVP